MKILSILVLAYAFPALAEEPKPYTSAALGFTATFPFEAHEALDPDGGGSAAAVDPQGIMYMVGSTPSRPDVGKSKSPKQQLDDGLDGALQKVHGTLASQKDVKLGSYVGREAEINLQGAHATFRAFVVGPRLVMIGVVVKDGVTAPMPAADFFKSLKIAKPKKS